MTHNTVKLSLFASPEKFMKTSGNASNRAVFEKAVPVFYYRPGENDCRCVLSSLLMLSWWNLQLLHAQTADTAKMPTKTEVQFMARLIQYRFF